MYPPVKYFGSRQKDNCSMPHIDTNRYILPLEVWEIGEQKRHLMRGALKNGGAGVRDGFFSLKPGHCLPCLSGKKQGILPILGLFCGFWKYIPIKCLV